MLLMQRLERYVRRQRKKKVGRYNPCTYFHREKGLRTFVHGDDFVTTGSRKDCKWFEDQLGRRFEIKTKVDDGAAPMSAFHNVSIP